MGDEGLRVVNPTSPRANLELRTKALANHVPAAAVIRGGRALPGFIGRKGRVGVLPSFLLNTKAQPWVSGKNWQDRGQKRQPELAV